MGIEDQLLPGAVGIEGQRLGQTRGGTSIHMILKIEGSEQGIGEDGHLPPGIDELGADVHEVKAIGEGGLDDGGLRLIEVGFQQIDAIDTQPGQVRPSFSKLFQPFIAGFD